MIETPAPCVKCARCGRALTAARSTARNLGPVCARKVKAAAALEAAPTVATFTPGKVRQSSQVPGLTYEVATRPGAVYVTFRYGRAFEVVEVRDGKAGTVDCSDRVGLPPAATAVCRAFIHQLASGLAGKVVA